MEKNSAKIKSLVGILVLIALSGGCVIYVGSSNQSAKFTKIVHMPVTPLAPGMDFQTMTHNGSIKILGQPVTDCSITATITANASTMKKAEEIADGTELSFEPTPMGLKFKIDRPDNMINCSVGVSLEITLADKMNLDLESYNGQIKIDNIYGKTNATTHNGQVTVNNVSGGTILKTYNGQINAKEISGDIDFISHNGSINADFSQAAVPDCNINIKTYNGGINLTAPQNYSATVDVSTYNGQIDTDLPITVTGKFSQKSLKGTIGDGQGQMKLETHNGSIKIR